MLPSSAKAEREAHFALFAKKDETALHASELNGELEESSKDVGDGSAGVELACGMKKEIKLLHFAGRLTDIFVGWRKHREGRKEVVCE